MHKKVRVILTDGPSINGYSVFCFERDRYYPKMNTFVWYSKEIDMELECKAGRTNKEAEAIAKRKIEYHFKRRKNLLCKVDVL